MSNHPEGGWRNPTWRAMAIADIVIMVCLFASLVLIVIRVLA